MLGVCGTVLVCVVGTLVEEPITGCGEVPRFELLVSLRGETDRLGANLFCKIGAPIRSNTDTTRMSLPVRSIMKSSVLSPAPDHGRIRPKDDSERGAS